MDLTALSIHDFHDFTYHNHSREPTSLGSIVALPHTKALTFKIFLNIIFFLILQPLLSFKVNYDLKNGLFFCTDLYDVKWTIIDKMCQTSGLEQFKMEEGVRLHGSPAKSSKTSPLLLIFL